MDSGWKVGTVRHMPCRGCKRAHRTRLQVPHSASPALHTAACPPPSCPPEKAAGIRSGGSHHGSTASPSQAAGAATLLVSNSPPLPPSGASSASASWLPVVSAAGSSAAADAPTGPPPAIVAASAASYLASNLRTWCASDWCICGCAAGAAGTAYGKRTPASEKASKALRTAAIGS